MVIQTRKWEVLKKLQKAKTPKLQVKQIVDILLENRGLKTKKEKEEFLKPTTPEKLGIKALGISQMEINKAVKRIKKANKTREKVIVYGDYDADGICATAILWETLYALGLNVLPYIPERFTEGYGLNIESIKKLKEEDPKLGLIITVDHGIVANKKVDFAKELGVDVIITDHHTPGKLLPSAYSLIHTIKIGGAGVAWILAREVAQKLQTSKTQKLQENHGLELAAMGTIADQLPLVDANRSFAKYGLEELNKTKRIGLLLLFEVAGIKKVGTYEVNFMIAPRLNAMGRMQHAMESLRLLCTKSPARAKELAEHLNRVNMERQKVVEDVVLHARSGVTAKSRGIIILAHESYHEGVIGLAAGRLVEEFYRPAIVLSKKPDISKASARSISGFNIIETIRKLESFYVEGGGHPMAAGFSIETSRIEEFSTKIQELATPLLTEEILTRKLRIDLEVGFGTLDNELVKSVEQFEPSGLGNPTPTFVSRNVEVVDARVVGREAKHLKLRLRQNSDQFDAIAFGFGELYPKLSPAKEVDIAYNLEQDTWNGGSNLQLKIKDIIVRN